MRPLVTRPAQAHEIADAMPAFTPPLTVMYLVTTPTATGTLPVLPLPHLLPNLRRDGTHRSTRHG
jgi:hypothetical protein